ncbi:YjjW family glycine radical enzyme activase [Vibrio sp. Of7-15]|uniref:YjjW family glycine radical enzyme activase n=1 Tax=Vibrio sp. Of7-15 TaxID=2724879 RepID=UPI001EF1DFF5|nr:YjjW family glycine radical enzyme activase [Vibrio sp. Of7-15]MCG7498089.1 YjjW family glycine radical enzyme activase [Vibrio sp. Of7-15]
MSIHFNKQGWVSKILTFSCVDGPGNRMVIFLQGCNFHCLNCHNPHTINHCNHCGDCLSTCPSGALTMNVNHKVQWDETLCTHCDVCLETCPQQSNPKVQRYSVSQLLNIIAKHKFFLNGITVTGGEATLQLPFITELFKAIKDNAELNHLTCFIDSNGSLSIDRWNKVMPYLDGTMIDLKAWQAETHQWLVGRGNHRVFQSINHLAKHNKLYEVRLLYIPDKTDLATEIEALGNYLKQLPSQVNIRLNAFQHHGVVGEARSWTTCSKKQMETFCENLSSIVQRELIKPSVYL